MKNENNRFEIKPSKINKERSLDNNDELTYNDAIEQSLKDQEAINKYLKTIKDEEE